MKVSRSTTGSSPIGFARASPTKAVYVYGAGGYYYPGKELSGLRDEMRRYLDLGYDTVKMKIGGAPLEQDLKRIEAVLQTCAFGPPSRLGRKWPF